MAIINRIGRNLLVNYDAGLSIRYVITLCHVFYYYDGVTERAVLTVFYISDRNCEEVVLLYGVMGLIRPANDAATIGAITVII